MLPTLVSLLAAAVLFVTLSRRFGFGSIVGYIAAGVLIGPQGLGLVTDVGDIAQIAQLGVLMLLFLIGLELRFPRIYLMRRAIFGLGTAYVLLIGAILSGLALWVTGNAISALILGFGLSLSSTAIVLPMLGERGLLDTKSGRSIFSVLLFQDLASIPLIALVPVLAGQGATGPIVPALAHAILGVAIILIGGRFLSRPIFRLAGGGKTQELFTATALLIVASSAAIANVSGLPMSLGAFAAGVVLSESEYRHELQADIEPFEGLLLGFFFISVGMSADISLMLAQPGLILAGLATLLLVKFLAGFGLGLIAHRQKVRALRLALALPQGSEFAFVLFGAAFALKALSPQMFQTATLIVALSMLVSPLLFALSEKALIPRLDPQPKRPEDDPTDAKTVPVIICGFDRFGQVIGRILRMRGIPFNALDADAENVDTVRRFGSKAYYGSSTRVDLLRAVGADEAKIIVIALPNPEEVLEVARIVQKEFPHLRIFARAATRQHAHLLMDLNVERFVRETFYSSLRLTELVLGGLGLKPDDAKRTVQMFREHDEQALIDQHEYYKDEKALIKTAKQSAEELRELFERDRSGIKKG